MLPTVTQIYAQTRANIGDTEVSGGQIYTDPILLPHVQEAVRVLYRGMRGVCAPLITKTWFYTLLENTNQLKPSTAGLDNFVAPVAVLARVGLDTYSINAATYAASPAGVTVTTSTANNFDTGDLIVLEQMGAMIGANTIAAITALSSTQFRANGVVTSGSYVSGGKAVKSANEFTPVYVAPEINQGRSNLNSQIGAFAWREGLFQFTTCTQATQLKILFRSSAANVTTGADIVEIDDSIDFLSYFTAYSACKAQGADDQSREFFIRSVGSGYFDGVTGGELLNLTRTQIQQIQAMNPYERGPLPFRTQMQPYANYW